jgi:hypothetical protein
MGHDRHLQSSPELTARRSANDTSTGAEPAAPLAPVPVTARPIMVGSAHDPAEEQADRIADAALSRLRRSGGGDGDEADPVGGAHVHRSAGTPNSRAIVGRC